MNRLPSNFPEHLPQRHRCPRGESPEIPCQSQRKAKIDRELGDRSFSGLFLRLGVRLCHLLLGETAWRLAQPQVCWQRDRKGHSFYQVYDPQSHKTYRFENTTEARAWLESRY